MMTRANRTLLLVATAWTAAWILAGSMAAAGARAAPAIELKDKDGAVVRLADYRGQVVLVDFWASWCAPCKASFPRLDTLYRDYRAKGFAVLAINVDEKRQDADAFLRQQPHAMTVLFDPKGVTPEAYAVQGMPSSVLIDRGGTIRFTHMGYTDRTLDTYRFEIATLLAERER